MGKVGFSRLPAPSPAIILCRETSLICASLLLGIFSEPKVGTYWAIWTQHGTRYFQVRRPFHRAPWGSEGLPSEAGDQAVPSAVRHTGSAESPLLEPLPFPLNLPASTPQPPAARKHYKREGMWATALPFGIPAQPELLLRLQNLSLQKCKWAARRNVSEGALETRGRPLAQPQL